MIDFFGGQKDDIIRHAKAVWPQECCGIIQHDEYIPLDNVADDPTKTFLIRPKDWIRRSHAGKIQAVVHSHNNFPHASLNDQQSQIRLKIPYVVVNLVNNNVVDYFAWGDQLPVQDLIGRKFYQGVYDCYSIVRDYYRMAGVYLVNHPRAYDWWHNGDNIIDNNKHRIPFHLVELDDIKKGDILFYGKNQISHMALYYGDECVLHHYADKLSARYPLHHGRDALKRAYRYDGVANDIFI